MRNYLRQLSSEDSMVCFYESVWITPLFSVGTSLLAALGSFGILKGLTELIVHKSFWWPLLFILFYPIFLNSPSPFPLLTTSPSPNYHSFYLSLLPCHGSSSLTCSVFPLHPLRWHQVVQPSNNNHKLGQDQVRTHLSSSPLLFSVSFHGDAFSL